MTGGTTDFTGIAKPFIIKSLSPSAIFSGVCGLFSGYGIGGRPSGTEVSGGSDAIKLIKPKNHAARISQEINLFIIFPPFSKYGYFKM